ncbi:phospholipase D-like domain-containing protein [soil metagenome]
MWPIATTSGSDHPAGSPEDAARWRRRLEGILGVPATTGNRVTVLRNGEEIFPAMLEAIRGAERFIDFLTFVYWTGDIAQEFAEALAERAAAGVRVRVLLDAVGARTMNRDLGHRMEAAGARVAFFRTPVTWRVWEAEHRTHRKVLIVDEHVGFTGGVGIAEEWMGDGRQEGSWRDTHFRVEGPAVDGLRGAFVSNWIETGAPAYDDDDTFTDQEPAGDHCVQVLRGAASVGWSDITIVMRALVRSAQHRLRITTAYFTPDEELVELLCAAAERGVAIQVLLPGRNADKRVVQLTGEATYERLLDCGVEISCYGPSMLHAKVITVDRSVALVGSANVNSRSMARDDEVCLALFEPGLVAELDGDFDHDCEHSEALDPAQWRRRHPAQRALETATNLIKARM